MRATFSSKEYHFFQDGELASIHLNVVQRFFRLLGFYANTREKVVASLAAKCFFEVAYEFPVKGDENLNLYGRKQLYFQLAKRLEKIELGKVDDENVTINYSASLKEEVNCIHYLFFMTFSMNDQLKSEITLKMTEGETEKVFHVFVTSVLASQEINPFMPHIYQFLGKILQHSRKFDQIELEGDTSLLNSSKLTQFGFQEECTKKKHTLSRRASMSLFRNCIYPKPISVDGLSSFQD